MGSLPFPARPAPGVIDQARMIPDMEGTTARYDRMADFYDRAVGDRISDGTTAALLDLVEDVRGRRVLDLACGEGRVARALARRGALVVGLDISEALLPGRWRPSSKGRSVART